MLPCMCGRIEIIMDHRTLTIVFTDMHGFTARTSTQSRSEMVELAHSLQTLLLPILTARGGRVIKSTGDGFLLAFESPTNAVLAGQELQAELNRRNITVGTAERIEVRIAINTGEVAVEHDDVLGDAVNVASRLLAITPPNGLYLTEATHLAMNAAECSVERVGARTFKGVPHPVGVYQAAPPDGVSRRPKRRLIVMASVGGVILLAAGVLALIGMRAVQPPTVAPATDTPSELPAAPMEEPAPADVGSTESPPPTEPVAEAPAAPDPTLLHTIAQTVQSYTDLVNNLKLEVVAADQELLNWSREMWNDQARYGRFSGQIAEIVRSIPQDRTTHNRQVQQLIDLANGREDRPAADALWMELGQFEAGLGTWEAQAQAMVPSIEAAYQAVKGWDKTISGWMTELAVLRQELEQRERSLPALQALTAWDASLDETGTGLSDLSTRIATFRQSLSALRADLDQRVAESNSLEEFFKGWHDFREQWRTYILQH